MTTRQSGTRPGKGKDNTEIEVSQGARDAAADLHLRTESGDGPYSPFDLACADAIRKGLNDHWDGPQAFARFEANTRASVPAVVLAARAIIDTMSSTYKARNGREVGIEADDGEKCWIVHSDQIEELRRALTASLASPVVDVREALEEAQRRLRLTQGCLDCNADDERFWVATIDFLKEVGKC